MASILDLFNNNNAQTAANAQTSAIQTGLAQGQNAINQGQTNANATYATGLAPTTANLATDQSGQTQYANALGLNGTAGAQSAVANWQATNPGYQAILQQGSNNVLRNQAKTGNLASGATDVDLQTLGQTQADQTYQQYLANLQPFIGASTANAGTAANLASNQATNQATAGNTLANLDFGANQSIGNAQASAALANQTAAANQFSALTGLLGGAAGVGGANSSGIAGLGSTIGKVGSSLASGIMSFV
jgi:hypothetical protein